MQAGDGLLDHLHLGQQEIGEVVVVAFAEQERLLVLARRNAPTTPGREGACGAAGWARANELQTCFKSEDDLTLVQGPHKKAG
jgi:hypothetical protein